MTLNTQEQRKHKHITFIGMPGVGKSTLGRKLAKKLDMNFLDVDSEIQKNIPSALQDYISLHGDDSFIDLEGRTILNLDLIKPTVIATGGSAVYHKEAMEFLRSVSLVVYLKDTLPHILKRIPNLQTRGIVGLNDRPLEVLFDERIVLYEAFAHVVSDLSEFFSDKKILDDIEPHL